MFTFTQHKGLHYLGRARDREATLTQQVYSTVATQPYLCKVHFPTKYTYVLIWRERWAHWVLPVKEGPWQTKCGLTKHGPQPRQRVSWLQYDSGLLIGTQSSLRPSYSITWEKARGSANGHLTKQDDEWLEEHGQCSVHMLSRWFSCLRISIVRLPRQ